MGKHFTIFDRAYPREQQAEAIAVSEAVARGKCNNCAFHHQCYRSFNFEFPVFAWCQQRKHQILRSWEE